MDHLSCVVVVLFVLTFHIQRLSGVGGQRGRGGVYIPLPRGPAGRQPVSHAAGELANESNGTPSSIARSAGAVLVQQLPRRLEQTSALSRIPRASCG